MNLSEYYLKYLQEVGEGSLPAPEGLTLEQAEPLARAAELQNRIREMGIVEFVRRCACAEGVEIPEEVYEAFCEQELIDTMNNLLAAQEAPEERPEEDAGPQPPQIQEPDGPRSVYEVLLDCCCLEENLFYYLLDILKRNAEEEFQKLALVTTRKAFTQQDFLYWLATREQRGSEEELVCVTVMDACFDRLAAQQETELIAALISGDQRTFELFRCEAPELCHLPDATFDWYERNYLEKDYPIRYMIKHNGIPLPKEV